MRSALLVEINSVWITVYVHVWHSVSTWDLEEEMVSYRVAGPSLLDDNIGQKVIVVYGNGSMIVHYQCWSFIRDLLHPMYLVAWDTGQSTWGMHAIPLKAVWPWELITQNTLQQTKHKQIRETFIYLTTCTEFRKKQQSVKTSKYKNTFKQCNNK